MEIFNKSNNINYYPQLFKKIIYEIQQIKNKLKTSTAPIESKPYKVYSASLTQSGTNAPTVIILENTLGITPVWTRESAGRYILTANSTFTLGKTVFISNLSIFLASYINISFSVDGPRNHNNTSNVIYFDTYNTSISQFADSLITGSDDDFLFVEIRVYN